MAIGKKIVGTAAVFAAVFFLTLAYLASPLSGPKFAIRSTASLPADAATSWQLLSDINSYQEWNPYLIHVDGVFKVDEQLTVKLVDGNFDEVLTVTPVMSEIEQGASFCWTGRLWLPGLFDTRHCFVLHEISTTETTIEQFEEFGGLVTFLVPAEESMGPHVLKSFESMHRAMSVELASLATARGT